MTTMTDHPDVSTTEATEAFKQVFRAHPAGVSIITGDDGRGPVGMTATSVISVSADPPVAVFSLSASSSATPHLQASDTLMVHLLDGRNLRLAKTFSTSGIDRFAPPTRWTRQETGEPLLMDARAWLRGRVVDRMEIAGSIVVALEVLDAFVDHDDDPETPPVPLVYQDRAWHVLGVKSRLRGW